MDDVSKEIVSLKNVSVYYGGNPALDNVSLSVGENAFLAIIGPNGGGKSTLLKVILGLVKPDRGSVEVFGKSPEEGRKSIGYLPQYKPFNMGFPISVFEVVLSGRYHGLLKDYTKEDHVAALDALEAVEMKDYADRQIGSLSGGQAQRVFLARALTREPRLLILDEPTASIDPEMQKTFYKTLMKLREKMAVIFVTHDIGAVSTYFKEIACLNRKLFYHGTDMEKMEKLGEIYGFPVELICHETPHLLLKNHEAEGAK